LVTQFQKKNIKTKPQNYASLHDSKWDRKNLLCENWSFFIL